MTETIALKSLRPLTHDVYELTLEKPEGFSFTAGQAAELAYDSDGWREEGRPFTMTSQPEDPQLEFVIKVYPDHEGGMTKEIPSLTPGSNMAIDGPFGAIEDKGPGVFIAGGAGLTPFIPILRKRDRDGTLDGCTLIFSNKTEADIIMRDEWEGMRGLKSVFTVTEQDDSALPKTFVDKALLKSHVETTAQMFYICGPGPMVDAVRDALREMDVSDDRIVTEEGW